MNKICVAVMHVDVPGKEIHKSTKYMHRRITGGDFALSAPLCLEQHVPNRRCASLDKGVSARGKVS